MAKTIPKHKIKDSVFTNLFQDKKYLLQLYKALHPEDCNVTENEIADITIKHVLIDAEVKVLYQENEKDIIGQYIIFSKVYNEQRKLYGNTKKTITETIRICKDKNVLKEYLESRERRLKPYRQGLDMMMSLFDDEQILKAYTKDIKDSTARETERKTEMRTARETAARLIKKGKMSLDEIADCVPALSLDEIKKLEAEIMQLEETV